MTPPTVLVTGAGIGIGRATAYAFSRAGYRVIVTDILETEGQEVADGIRQGGGEAQFHWLDVTDTAKVNDLLGDVEEQCGALDVLVNNAGIAYRLPLATMTDEEWDHTLDVDLKGMNPFYFMQSRSKFTKFLDALGCDTNDERGFKLP